MKYMIGEWMAEGKRRFGDSMLRWKFVCPACKHVQMPEDFRPFKHIEGVSPDTARFNCIGRYSGANANAGLSGSGEDNGPCNYTSGGLFDLRPDVVVTPEGEVKSFAFADVEGGAQ